MDQPDLINFDWLIISTFKFIRKYILIFLSVTILGIATGYIYSSFKKPVYESTMIAYSSILSDVRIMEMLEEIKDNLEQKEYGLLSQKLGLTSEEIKNINSLDIEKIETPKEIESTLFIDYSESCLKIEIAVYDPEVIILFQHGVKQYLESNDMISKALSSRKRSFEELILESNKEISKIENLQEALISAVKEGKDMFYMVEKSTTHFDKIQLLKEKELYIEKLEFLAPLVVIKPFYIPEHPVSINTMLAAISGLAFLIICIIVVGIREINSHILS